MGTRPVSKTKPVAADHENTLDEAEQEAIKNLAQTEDIYLKDYAERQRLHQIEEEHTNVMEASSKSKPG